jgi:hypothetical protein
MKPSVWTRAGARTPRHISNPSAASRTSNAGGTVRWAAIAQIEQYGGSPDFGAFPGAGGGAGGWLHRLQPKSAMQLTDAAPDNGMAPRRWPGMMTFRKTNWNTSSAMQKVRRMTERMPKLVYSANRMCVPFQGRP